MSAVLSPATGAAETTRSRWYWRNWPVVVKLAAVLLVPTVVALVAGVLRIVDQAGAAPAYARISQVAGVQQQLSDLIGGLARERDMATAFVAQGRLGGRPRLDLQFRSVDSSVRVVSATAAQVSGLGFTRAPLAALGSLGPLRASVTTGFGPAELVITEYSDTIDPLIELDAGLTRQLDDVAVTNDAAAVHALVAGREQVSRQHAIVSAALYANHLEPVQIEDLRTAAVRLTAEQDAVREALLSTGTAGRPNPIAGIGQDAELSRQRMLQRILDLGVAGAPLNVSPSDWDQSNALAVANIDTLEKQLRQRIERTAHALLEHVRAAAGLNSVILFFALALGVLVGIFVTRALLRPLAVLKRTALDVADRRLPEAMARIRDGELPGTAVEPVPVGTREEIGQVARAFDEVHSQAVRLASEQAQLRANVNDIFVNLSRRTQGLVERQLKLIDRLESGEQNPQQLDNLFQLDHLATRMRRNSENLLVLAGTDATSRTGRPVRLVDVLRAAVSEVEQYQSLVLQQPPAVLVLGRSASDLVHLLAELLDNATQFSPPDSQVIVSSDFAADGSVIIDVADCGVGMTGAELAEANQRLADPPAVDASVSRRMGLFVVGRLAGRHGITVQLCRGEGNVGVCACVTMPPRLVRVASEVVEPPAAAASQGAQTSQGAQANGHKPDGYPTQSAGQPTLNDSRDDAKCAQHIGKPLTSAQSSPAPPGPSASSPAGAPVGAAPNPGSGAELFRATRTAVGSGGLGHRTTLQHSTPIFDDVASAWFKEHEAVPVRWTAPSARGSAVPTWEVPAPGSLLPDPPLPDPPLPHPPPTNAAASATAGSLPLTRRQPGKTLADSSSEDSPPEPTIPADSPALDWGAADEGWRAAQALAMPVSAEVTAMGLPRRQPRAMLVPGAAGAARPSASVPVRSPESIRGRLSSYQQGVREGRQARRSPDQQGSWSPPDQTSEQQDGKEETE